MSIRIISSDLHVLHMRTRMPFRYGIATLTELPHLFVRLAVEIDGMVTHGIASDGLAPKWFTKDPTTTTDHDIAEMIAVIRSACTIAQHCAPVATVFGLWRDIAAAQRAWGDARGMPPLLSGLGTSLVERCMIDAWCRVHPTTFTQAVRDDSLGIQLGALHPELDNTHPAEWLPAQPLARIVVRHTVGLTDPIVDEDIASDERIGDGFPQSLVACVRHYGLTHFKIKISGNEAADIQRLRRIADVLTVHSPNYQFTLDGNEQFHDIAHFRAAWQTLATDPMLAPMLQRLIFVEQPVHRASALSAASAHALRAWGDRPPIIIDESDGSVESVREALAAGYVGTSHKNCKGVFKGIANACLIARRQQTEPDGRYILSGEDLANVGPVALLQDLAVMAVLGVAHVERNGHHYFAGLSMYGPDVQEQVRAVHSDLYQPSAHGTTALSIHDGAIDVRSVVAAPFGVGFPFDVTAYAATDQ